jgi:hypothetical protein
MSQDLEQAFAEYLGTSFVSFPGWEPQASGGGMSALAKLSSELRAKAKGHTLRRIKYPPKVVEPWPTKPLPMSMSNILRAVSLVTGISQRDIHGRGCFQDYMRARHIYFWCCRYFMEMSYPRIGRALSRDHSTVMHGVKKIDERMDLFENDIEKIGKLMGVYE